MPKNNPIDSATQELLTFLAGFSLCDVASDKDFVRAVTRVYKAFHPLLVWYNHIRLHQPGNFVDQGQYTDFQHYQAEVTSNLCQAILLFSQGLYKPGYLLIRGAIENFFRCIGIYENQPVLQITSVANLIDFVKTSPIIAAKPEHQKEFDKLRMHYANLCAFVHTKNTSFMSLSTVLGGLPCFDPVKAAKYVLVCRSIFSGINILLTGMFREELSTLHHLDHDLILDSIPPGIKRTMFE